MSYDEVETGSVGSREREGGGECSLEAEPEASSSWLELRKLELELTITECLEMLESRSLSC